MPFDISNLYIVTSNHIGDIADCGKKPSLRLYKYLRSYEQCCGERGFITPRRHSGIFFFLLGGGVVE